MIVLIFIVPQAGTTSTRNVLDMSSVDLKQYKNLPSMTLIKPLAQEISGLNVDYLTFSVKLIMGKITLVQQPFRICYGLLRSVYELNQHHFPFKNPLKTASKSVENHSAVAQELAARQSKSFKNHFIKSWPCASC